MPQNFVVVLLTLRTNMVFLLSQKLDSTKWRAVLGKPRNFEALYSTFKTSFLT